MISLLRLLKVICLGLVTIRLAAPLPDTYCCTCYRADFIPEVLKKAVEACSKPGHLDLVATAQQLIRLCSDSHKGEMMQVSLENTLRHLHTASHHAACHERLQPQLQAQHIACWLSSSA